MVYFVQQAGGVGPIKIGHTSILGTRLESLQAGSPVPLVMLGWLPGDNMEERALHRRFAKSRLHSEWFAPTPALLALVARSRPANDPWLLRRIENHIKRLDAQSDGRSRRSSSPVRRRLSMLRGVA